MLWRLLDASHPRSGGDHAVWSLPGSPCSQDSASDAQAALFRYLLEQQAASDARLSYGLDVMFTLFSGYLVRGTDDGCVPCICQAGTRHAKLGSS